MSGRDLEPSAVDAGLPAALRLVPSRRLVVQAPLVRIRLQPGDRALVGPGEAVLPGAPLAERTRDAALVDAGVIEAPQAGAEADPAGADAAGAAEAGRGAESGVAGWAARGGHEAGGDAGGDETARGHAAGERLLGDAEWAGRAPEADRRSPPFPGKRWTGGEQRRGRLGRRYVSRRLGGTLLYEINGRWRAAAGERHEVLESPVAGTVRDARNGVEISLIVTGAAIPGAVATGEPAHGYLEVPEFAEGEIRLASVNVGLSGAIVVAGSRVGAEALTRARATAIRGMVAASIGQGDLRDLAASDTRQRASLHSLPPFAVLGLDGYLRRPIPTPVMDLLHALAGHDVAIVTDPPLLVFDAPDVPLPEVSPDWVRIVAGPLAGREGRWLGPAGIQRFRGGSHLEAAFVRLEDEPAAVVPLGDIERFEA